MQNDNNYKMYVPFLKKGQFQSNSINYIEEPQQQYLK